MRVDKCMPVRWPYTRGVRTTFIPELMLLSLMLLLMALVVVLRNRGTRAARDGFGQVLKDVAYTMLDERCWLKEGVASRTCVGLVRHPTEAAAGTCVLRDTIPGGGACDPTNQVMFRPDAVKSFGMEDVDGRQECVLRMKQELSDASAKDYSKSLQAAFVVTSDLYIDKVEELSDSVALVAELRAQVKDGLDRYEEKQAAMTRLQTKETQCEADYANTVIALQTSRNETSAQTRQNETDRIRATSWHKDRMREAEQACIKRVQTEIDNCKARECVAVPCVAKGYAKVWGDIRGQDFMSFKAPNQGKCVDQCNKEDACTSFNWDDNNTCWLKTGDVNIGGTGKSWLRVDNNSGWMPNNVGF